MKCYVRLSKSNKIKINRFQKLYFTKHSDEILLGTRNIIMYRHLNLCKQVQMYRSKGKKLGWREYRD